MQGTRVARGESRHGLRIVGRGPRHHSSHLPRARRRRRDSFRRPISTIPCTTPRRVTGASPRAHARLRRRSARTMAPSPPASLEACSQVLVDGCDVLLVAFDLPAPEPLHAKRCMAHPAAAAARAHAAAHRALDGRADLRHDVRSGNDARGSRARTTAARQSRGPRPAADCRSLALQRFGSVVLPMGPGANLAVELRAP